MDEAGFSTKPARRTTWGALGKTPVVKIAGRGWTKISAAGALTVSPGGRGGKRRRVGQFFRLYEQSINGEIWKSYGGTHPLADSTKLEKFFSKVVTRDEYIEFLDSTLAVLNGQGTSTAVVTCETSDFGDGIVVLEKFVAGSAEGLYTATLVETGMDGAEPPAVAAVVAGGCLSQCMNGPPPCGTYKYWIQRFGCRQGCAALCAVAAVVENLDGGIPAFQ